VAKAWNTLNAFTRARQLAKVTDKKDGRGCLTAPVRGISPREEKQGRVEPGPVG
jgi:hypothetical protein